MKPMEIPKQMRVVDGDGETSPRLGARHKAPTTEAGVGSSEKNSQKEYRTRRLQEVFAGFDIDGGGTISSDELFQMGTARRKLGQKKGTWTKEQNERMIAHIKEGRSGEVTESEFVKHFEAVLPHDSKEFDVNMEEFLAVARTCSSGAGEGDDAENAEESVQDEGDVVDGTR